MSKCIDEWLGKTEINMDNLDKYAAEVEDYEIIMVTEESLKQFLARFHPDKLETISLNHIEDLTNDMENEYINWLRTDEGMSYLRR